MKIEVDDIILWKHNTGESRCIVFCVYNDGSFRAKNIEKGMETFTYSFEKDDPRISVFQKSVSHHVQRGIALLICRETTGVLFKDQCKTSQEFYMKLAEKVLRKANITLKTYEKECHQR
jgi:hypothetical protein